MALAMSPDVRSNDALSSHIFSWQQQQGTSKSRPDQPRPLCIRRKKWGLAAADICPWGKCQTMSGIVNSCPQTKLEGGLQLIALS